MRMLVVGAGSTGGYFGGRLAQAGRDITFLVRPARAQLLRTNGLQIVSPHGDFAIEPRLVTAGGIGESFDLILLAVKAFALKAALEDLAPAVGPGTMILPLLNGMRHMELLCARYGEQAVVGCVCKISTVVDERDRIVQLSTLQNISYGERDGSVSARMGLVDTFMQGAGFDTRLSSTITRDMWEKWVLLSTLGAATCLMRGNIGEIVAAQGGADFVLRLIDEVTCVAVASGVPPSDKFLLEAKTQLTAKGSPFAASMYRDLQRGNRIEADQIVGDLLLRGKNAGVATPLLAAAYTHLDVYQRRIGA